MRPLIWGITCQVITSGMRRIGNPEVTLFSPRHGMHCKSGWF